MFVIVSIFVLLVLSSLCRKRKDINSENLFPCKCESEITKKKKKVHHVLRSMLLNQDNRKMPLMRFRKSSSSDIQISIKKINMMILEK
jgi:hypothetical protein